MTAPVDCESRSDWEQRLSEKLSTADLAHLIVWGSAGSEAEFRRTRAAQLKLDPVRHCPECSAIARKLGIEG